MGKVQEVNTKMKIAQEGSLPLLGNTIPKKKLSK